jgi:formylglycine-generating enzyme required for sulfatase activity
MSPQQMMGEKPAVTDDIYALGATLYDLLTGKPPFFSGNILMQVQNKVPPTLAARRAELGHTGAPIPAEWEATIAACLAKDSAERPQSAGEVAQLLGLGGSPQRGAGDAKQEAPKVARVDPNAPAAAADNGLGSSRSTSKTPLYVGLAAVGVVLAVMGWLELVHAPEQRRLEAEARRAQERQIEAEGENSAAVAASRPIMIRDLGLEMLPISPGRFAMGSASGGLDHERPVTQVTISRPFWLGKTEVTQAQWEALMGSDPSNFKGANLPVEQVTWDEAMAFCQKLTERERAAGRLPEGYAYTLPTETQWEYACRAGTTGDYAGHLDTMGWYDANSGNSTNPVGQKQANAWGLHDMHGNVWEWCLDWYGNYPGGSVTDPSGPGSGSHRVIRGGSWLPFAVNCRSAFRFMITPDIRENSLGFRVALTPARTSPART